MIAKQQFGHLQVLPPKIRVHTNRPWLEVPKDGADGVEQLTHC